MYAELVNDTNAALKWKDDQALAALSLQKATYERLQSQCSQEVKDITAVKVARATNDDRLQASRRLNSEMQEERGVTQLRISTAE